MHYSAFRLFFVAHPRGFLHLGYKPSRNATKHTNNNSKIISIKKVKLFMDNIVDWLQNWTMSQIDGDWEHEQGISIGMLDNPGWILKADISNYGDFLKASKPWGRDNDKDWIDFEIKIIAKTYVYIEIFGDINKLNKILYSFKAIIEELEEIEKKGKGILTANRIKEIVDSVL